MSTPAPTGPAACLARAALAAPAGCLACLALAAPAGCLARMVPAVCHQALVGPPRLQPVSVNVGLHPRNEGPSFDGGGFLFQVGGT